MRLALSDNGAHLRFAPLTLTRPVGNLRLGIITNDERWKLFFPEAQIGYVTEDYLKSKFSVFDQAELTVNAQLIPNEEVVHAIRSLKKNESLYFQDVWMATWGEKEHKRIEYVENAPVFLQERWDLFLFNESVIESDFKLITKDRTSQAISDTNTVIGNKKDIFLEEGAVVEGAFLNATHGPIYIGKESEVMEGSLIRGPFALCEHAAVKMGGKIYGGTTIGPFCKVGGEVSNSIFYAYSNKGHDGFLGNSLIGQWCNLGADTNTSNLKNNYSKVSTYSFEQQQEVQTSV